MYPVSEDILNSYTSYSRAVMGKAIINDTYIVEGDSLINFTVKPTIDDGSGISIGGAFSSALSIHFRDVGSPRDDLKIQVFVDVNELGYVPLGTFYSTDVDSDDDYVTIKVSAYDKIALLTEKVTPAEMNTASIVRAICETYDVPMSSHLAGLLGTGFAIEGEGEYDARTWLGYIAGLYGKNAIMTYDGELDFVGFNNTDIVIDRDNQYESGFQHKAKDDYTVESIVAKVGEEEIAVGTGTPMVFENPFITRERLTEIFADLEGLQLTPSTCKYRGIPVLEVGDIVYIEDKDNNDLPVVITSHSITVGGGMAGDITSSALSDSGMQTQTTGTVEKIRVIAASAQKTANVAMVSADGKSTVFHSNREPGGNHRIGDLWFDTSKGNAISRWDGSKWVKSELGNNAIASLSASKITAGELDCADITVSNLDAGSIETGTLDASKVTIDNLSANAIKAGTITAAVTATNLNMTGGSINLNTSKESFDMITLNSGDYKSVMRPSGFKVLKDVSSTVQEFGLLDHNIFMLGQDERVNGGLVRNKGIDISMMSDPYVHLHDAIKDDYLIASADSLQINKGSSNTKVRLGSDQVDINVPMFINGKTPLHSGNYSDYALPLAGGTMTGNLNVPAVGKDGYIAYPKGGTYLDGLASVTGYLKIVLPKSASNTMIKFKVSIYDYSEQSGSDYFIGGYNYQDTKWYNPSAVSIGKGKMSNLPVQFGYASGKNVVYIGYNYTVWSYPQVTITDVTLGFKSKDYSYWAEGWTIDFTTSLGTITQTITNPAVVNAADKVYGRYTSNGGRQNPDYFGTGRVGFLMSNQTVNGNAQYKDWMYMDCYTGSDAGGTVAIGVNRQSLGAYIMRSASARTSWAESAEIITTANISSQLEAISYTTASDVTAAANSSSGTLSWTLTPPTGKTKALGIVGRNVVSPSSGSATGYTNFTIITENIIDNKLTLILRNNSSTAMKCKFQYRILWI